jgi:uncharacterized protein with HEPN domain
MSKRDWKLLLEDILEAAVKIEHYTKKLTHDDFIKNSMVVVAVVRNLEIIGEAAKMSLKRFRINCSLYHGKNSPGSETGLFMNISALT